VLAAGADTFLRSSGAGVVAPFESEEDFLELVHAGVGEQQRRVVRRSSEELRHNAMAMASRSREACRIELPVTEILCLWSNSN